MNTQFTTNLLRQYNANSPYTRTQPIDSRADEDTQKFGTWSYANMYDALYDRFSSYRNFNVDMLQEAIKRGEQDQYFAFLEQNKDRELSAQFYDPQYYDYEAMMTEMFLPFTDNEKLEHYTQEVWDPVAGSYVVQDLGDMTQRQYHEYLLNNVRTARNEEITRGLEQWRKDQMTFMGKLGHDTLATLAEFGEGVLTGLVGLVDFVAAVGTGGLLPYRLYEGEGNYLDAFVDYFGENGLTATEKRTVRAALDEYERTHTHFRDLDGNMTGVGKYVAGISNSIGMMIPAIVTNIATGGAAMVGTSVFYASIFSTNMHEVATNPELADEPAWHKITNVTVKTGAEAIIEYALGKMLGTTIQNEAIGLGKIGGKGVIESFGKWSGLKYLLKSAGQEGLEEFLQDFSTHCVDQFMGLWDEGYANDGVTGQTLVDSFCIGVLSSLVMSGAQISLINAISDSTVIETKDGLQELKGLNKFYYNQIVANFKDAIKELQSGKMSTKKNLALAQEIYGAISAISQFYSSFDTKRIENCERLLSRVMEAEKAQLDGSVIGRRAVKKARNQKVNEASKTFATSVGLTFATMDADVRSRWTSKINGAAAKQSEKLEKGRVTQSTGAISADGVRYQRDPDMVELESRLGKKAVNTLDVLRKGYEWVITTDGHIACEQDGFLFVSEAWLKNYSPKDIIHYLEQTRVVETILGAEKLKPMIKALTKFDREFQGRTDIDSEQALLDLLFNKSVFQAFLLSNAGENLHEFSINIFALHDIIHTIAEKSTYHNQKFRGKQAQTRINMLNQIYQHIKDTWREPTLKAILNWGLDPQKIAATSILRPKDLETINQYKEYHKSLDVGADGKTGKSRYEHFIEDIVKEGDFGDNELALIEKARNGTATTDEELIARMLLELASDRMHTPEFEASPKASLAKSYAQRFKSRYDELLTLMTSGAVDTSLFVVLLQDMRYSTSVLSDIRMVSKYTPGYLDAIRAWEENLDAYAEQVYEKLNELTYEDLKPYLDSGIELYQRGAAELSGKGRAYAQGIGAFTIPYQAAAIAVNDGDMAGAQFVADVLNTFKITYGISARQMITGDLTGMSVTQRNQLVQDMDVLGVDHIVNFVIKKLENMFEGKYVVTPTRFQHKSRKQSDGDFIVTTLALKEEKDFARMSDELQTSRDAVERWFVKEGSRANRIKSQDTAYTMVEDFYERSYPIQKQALSNFADYLPGDIDNFWRELGKRFRSGDAIDALKYIVSMKSVIEEAFETLDANITRAAGLEIEQTRDRFYSEVYDFVIAKTIPAKRFISQELLNENVTERNHIFREMFNRATVQTLNAARKIIIANVRNPALQSEKAYLEYLGRLPASEFMTWLDRLVNVNSTYANNIVNPETSEVFTTDAPFGELLVNLRNTVLQGRGLPLSELVDVSAFPTIDLSDVRVILDPSTESEGWTSGTTIGINPRAKDCISTLVHEVNHVLQGRYDLPGGFNQNDAIAMPDFLAYILNHYYMVVDYLADRGGYTLKYELPKTNDFTEADIIRLPAYMQKLLAYCGYRLVQGELWANAYDHNGKMVHGFANIWNGKSYLLAPDGKTKFLIRYLPSKSNEEQSESISMSETMTESALGVAMKRLFKLKWQQEVEGSKSTSRDTYHSTFTRTDKMSIVNKILDPTLGPIAKFTTTLDDVIRNPRDYLAPEILAACKGDFSEGNVFFRVKEFVEDAVPGISIDLDDTQEYVWVDDNEFDELYNPAA